MRKFIEPLAIRHTVTVNRHSLLQYKESRTYYLLTLCLLRKDSLISLTDSWSLQKIAYYTHALQVGRPLSHSLYVHPVISPHFLTLTSARVCTVSRQPRWSSWARGGGTAKAWFPLVFPVSQSVYNSTTAGCHGVTVNELQMPDIRANQGAAVSHHGPQVPPFYGHAPPVPPPGLQIYC